MKYHNHIVLTLVMLICALPAIDASTITKLVPRSQSVNAARDLVGWNNVQWGINRLPQDDWYASMNLTFEYTRTFRSSALAESFFGEALSCSDDCGSNLHISGSQATDRAENDWLADYFGLPTDFKSTVSFKPQISNYILDFALFVGLDAWYEGLYFRLHGPFVHTSWKLNANECGVSAGTNLNVITANDNPALDGSYNYLPGYFSSTGEVVADLNTSFLQYAHGAVPTLGEAGSRQGFDPVIFKSLCCGQMVSGCDCDGLSVNGFAELRAIAGLNFLNHADGDYHLGAGIYAAAPTGSKVGQGKYGNMLFEPIVGNGHHWELGAQATGHYIWWRSEDNNASFGMYFEANVSHLFKTTQVRCFDLCSAGDNSRFMLAQQLGSNIISYPHISNSQNGSMEFAGIFAPVANITRSAVSVSYPIQADIAVMLEYESNNFSIDLGYNFYGRSCEKISRKNDCCNDLFETNWALKGDNQVYGFFVKTTAPLSQPVALAATDSAANIHTGSNLEHHTYGPGTPGAITKATAVNYRNRSADNAVAAVDNDFSNPIVNAFAQGNDSSITSYQDYTSDLPLYIQESDINYEGSSYTTNKIFAHVNYVWKDREGDWTPYAGFGVEAEFGRTRENKNDCDSCESSCETACESSCTTSCTTTPCSPCELPSTCCPNAGLSQWGVWLKLGASYR